MHRFILAFLFSLYFAAACLGQSINSDKGRACATTAYIELLKQKDAGFSKRQSEAEQVIQQELSRPQQGQNLRSAVITVPVVFHVVYNSAAENISDAQVLSQLRVLNDDFRRQNADAGQTPSYFLPFAADAEIEFCLATTNPDGEPTNGITRTRSTKEEFSYTTDDVKFSKEGGVNGWDPSQYLNIWICNIEGGQIIGYATPPGAARDIDGVVLHYKTIGAAPANPFVTNYNMGRTATHEVGHWLGLRHIWGGGGATCTDSDGITDTPNQEQETVGCPDGIVQSCDNSPYGNMWQNYMDYSNDACMNLFTFGQANYMKAVLNTSRSSIFNSVVCSNTLRSEFRAFNERDTLVIAGTSVRYSDASLGVRPTSWLWEFEGGTPATSTERNPVVRYTKPGKYNVSLTISNGNLSSTEVKEDYIHVTVDDLAVYPNPAVDFITIEQPAKVLVRKVQLLNNLGVAVLDEEVRSRIIRFDTRHLPAGIYFLHIESTNGTELKKISILK